MISCKLANMSHECILCSGGYTLGENQQVDIVKNCSHYWTRKSELGCTLPKLKRIESVANNKNM